MSRAPRVQRLLIDGPAGELESLLEMPADAGAPRHYGVVCHPHPLFGGTMENKVAHTLARSLHEAGMPSVRFNFRGVGASAGSYAEGEGETHDALAVLAWARARWPAAEPLLLGFSFGGVVAIRAAAQVETERLVTVAPAIGRIALDGALPRCPWLIVQGDADDVVAPREVLDWAAGLSPPPTIALLAGAGHYFHGRLTDLKDAVTTFLKQKPGQ